ncbi:hypothetical protein BGZ63DRAFT_32814 [Mariannaea sp. PMI_226]|nr:hypothetical protein BGZ63DRAFT_32814 [Mariannaea sp. PMI_226]
MMTPEPLAGSPMQMILPNARGKKRLAARSEQENGSSKALKSSAKDDCPKQLILEHQNKKRLVLTRSNQEIVTTGLSTLLDSQSSFEKLEQRSKKVSQVQSSDESGWLKSSMLSAQEAYQMQLMLLEQHGKNRLFKSRPGQKPQVPESTLSDIAPSKTQQARVQSLSPTADINPDTKDADTTRIQTQETSKLHASSKCISYKDEKSPCHSHEFDYIDLDQQQYLQAPSSNYSPKLASNNTEPHFTGSDQHSTSFNLFIEVDAPGDCPLTSLDGGVMERQSSQEQHQEQRTDANRTPPCQMSLDIEIMKPISNIKSKEPQKDYRTLLDQDTIPLPPGSEDWDLRLRAELSGKACDGQAVVGSSLVPIPAEYSNLALLLETPGPLSSLIHDVDAENSAWTDEPQLFDPMAIDCPQPQIADLNGNRESDTINPSDLTQVQSVNNEVVRSHPLYNGVPGADGLYHCPFEDGLGCNHKPNKLKCNFDKFIDSHLKPFNCQIPACESGPFSSGACRLRHEREAHFLHGQDEKPFQCPHKGCERAVAGNGFQRRWNLVDHMRRIHKTGIPPSRRAPSGRTPDQMKPQKQNGSAGAKPRNIPKAERKAILKASWIAQLKALKATIGRLDGPSSPETTQVIKDAQDLLSSISDIELKMSGLK